MGQQAEVSGFIREGNFSGQRDLCTPRPQLGEASAAAPVPVGPGDVLRKKERNHMPTFDKILPYNMKSFIMNSSLERKIIRDGGQVRAWIFPGPALSSLSLHPKHHTSAHPNWIALPTCQSAFCCCDKIFGRSQLKRGKVYYGSWFQSKVS
jgi:hypothetical protein